MYSQIFITKTIKIESDIVEIQTNAHSNYERIMSRGAD